MLPMWALLANSREEGRPVSCRTLVIDPPRDQRSSINLHLG